MQEQVHDTEPGGIVNNLPTVEGVIFEFLSLLHYKDLLRLHEDRHRCAHPSMHSLEEPYQPTKELVQYHLQVVVQLSRIC